MDVLTPEAFLAAYPPEIGEAADRLRAHVRGTVPNSVERVRPGWRVIGYDLPVGRRTVYFAYVAPEAVHVHLGFEHGTSMSDPGRLLEGAHLGLRRVRYLTFTAGQEILESALIPLIREAARVTMLTRQERSALAFDREWTPQARP